MGLRQHRCPFYQLKIEKKDLELLKSKKNDRQNSLITTKHKLILFLKNF